MKRDRREDPPAHRLGTLYVASFCMIALLSGISQAFILRELSWQSGAIYSVARSARHRSPDDSLSVLATAILAASEPAERQELEDSLRSTIQLNRHEGSAMSPPGGGPSRSSSPDSRSFALQREAEMHRQKAIESAESLLTFIERNRSVTPRTAESSR